MIRMLKKTVLSVLSVLVFSFALWALLLFNPSLVYAHETQVDFVTIHHTLPLEESAEAVVKDAIDILKKSELYDGDIKIDLCMNDGAFYPELWIFKGGAAYSFINKAVMYNSTPDFKNNKSHMSWAINHYEKRSFNLTSLLAHEMMHTLQSKEDRLSPLKFPFWKNEGDAEYVARGFEKDGQLIEKIDRLLIEEQKEHVGIPILEFPDGNIGSIAYFQYVLMIQYLREVELMSRDEVMLDKRTFEEVRGNMIVWWMGVKDEDERKDN